MTRPNRVTGGRRRRVPGGVTLSGVCASLLVGAVLAGTGEIIGLATVQDDGSLLIKGRSIELHGVYLPPTERQCRTWIRPVRCASRAALALDFRVSGFVTCYPRARPTGNRTQATCYVDRTGLDTGEDLAAYLIERGWALALPNAPFGYHALERIARAHGRGVWGTPVDAYGEP